MSQPVEQLSFFEKPAPSSRDWFAGLDQGDPDGLRYYQREAYDAVHAAFEGGVERTCVVKATGLGKTQLFGAIAAHWPGRVLVMAHRKELVDQAAARLELMSDERVGVEMAERRSMGERIVVGSVQTLCKKARQQRVLARGAPTLVIVDELHHYVSKTYKATVEVFLAAGAKLLGVTATPDRTDKLALGQLVGHVAYEKQLGDGINEGWLVPLIGEAVHIESINLDHVKTVAGDFAKAQLDEEIAKSVGAVVEKVLELHPERRGPIFFPAKNSARLAHERFNALRPMSARLLTDDTPPGEREQLIRELRRGDFQFLCNVLVASEGFDWPEADLVGLARPTKSRVIHCQMVGRGTRVLPGTIDGLDEPHLAEYRKELIAKSKKPHCVILDFVGNCQKHELVSIVDLMAGEFTEAEVKKAKQLEKSEGGGDPRDLLKRARRELQQLAKAMSVSVQASVTRFDPFAQLCDTTKAEDHDLRYGFTPATEDQREALSKYKVDCTGLSKFAASQLLSTIYFRRKHGLATVNQLRTLNKYGWTDNNLTYNRAHAMLDYCAQKKWKDVSMDVLTRLSKGKE